MKKLLAAIFILSVGMFFALKNADAGKYDPEKMYSVDELKADLSFAKDKLEHRNPDLYLFHSQQEIDSAFKATEKMLVAPMTDVDFYKLLCPLTAFFRDGHTLPNLSSDSWKTYFGKDSTYIPLNLVNIGDRIFSTKTLGPDTTLKAGDEILSIDGMPAAKIIDTLKRNITRDGYSDGTPSFLLSMNFLPNYSMFIGKPAGYNVKFKHDSVVSEHYFKAQPSDTLVAYFRGKGNAKKAAKPLGIHLFLDSATNSARLAIPSFDGSYLKKHYHQNFRNEISNAFATIRKGNIQDLIIDLRGNGGGNSRWGKFLLRHLIDSTFRYAEECMMVKKNNCRDTLKRLKHKWLPDAGLGKISPVKNVYSGKLYVLIDGGTFSASCCVSSCLRAYDRAIFIGSETGGQQYRSGGYQARSSFTLPNTKIRFATSNVMTIIRENSGDAGRGIIPDYPVVPTIKDYLERNDTVLHYAKAVISEKARL